MKLSQRLPLGPKQVVVGVVGIAVIGAVVLVAALAAGAFISAETENGTLAGGAKTITDSNASGGKAVQFASATTPTPIPSPTPSPGFNTCASPTHTIPYSKSDPQTGVSIGNFYVTNDTWNIGTGGSQTMYICDYNNWYAMATEPNTTSVKTYPNVHQDFNEPLISSFHTISSSYAETAPHTGIYEYAYDIWLNGVADNNSTEVMIWNDNFHQAPSGSKRGTFTSGGQTYDVYSDGTSCAGGCYIAFVAQANNTSGAVNLLDFFNYIIGTQHWLANTATLGQIDYGVEICSTNGAATKFELNNFSLIAQ
jgi:hypothetical protein